MRIGFFTDRYYPLVDGVSVSIDVFASELEKLGHEVYIFCPAGPGKQPPEPANIIRFRSMRSIWHSDHRDTMPWTPANARLIRSYNLDMIHVHTPTPIGFMGARIAITDNIPLVTTYHTDIEQYAKIYKPIMAGFVVGLLIGPLILNAPYSLRERLSSMRPDGSGKGDWSGRMIRDTLNALHRNFDLVIAPSRKMEKLLKRYHTPAPITILPTGINWGEVIKPSSYSLRKEYNLDEDTPVLLYLGRIGEEKNLELLVRMMPHILRKEPNTRLVLAGPGEDETKRLSDIAQSLSVEGSITFTGGLSRVQAMGAFATSDVFVFPSVTDTQGLVIGEAAAHAKPIVFVDDQISELTINGKTGLKAKNNPKDFAAKCLHLIENRSLMNKYGAQSKQRAHDLSAENQAKRLVGLYSEVVTNHKPSQT